MVQAGVFESPSGVALVLGNFTYERIRQQEIRPPVKRPPKHVWSLEEGSLKFTTDQASRNLAAQGCGKTVWCTVELGLNDILLFE